MVDCIMIRTFAQSDVEGLAEFGSIPVINGLTDDFHPCQALADIMTVYEHKGAIDGLKMAFIGDGNNVAHSLMLICAKLGIDFSIGCPPGFEPSPSVVSDAVVFAKESGAVITVTNDAKQAIRDADAVYTDVWASMGQESEFEEKQSISFPIRSIRHSPLMPRMILSSALSACSPRQGGLCRDHRRSSQRSV